VILLRGLVGVSRRRHRLCLLRGVAPLIDAL
jgi:hypothetical protein